MSEWAQAARLRQGLYRWFGGALLSPSADRIEMLTAAAALLSDWDIERYAFSKEWDRLCDHLIDGIDLSVLEHQHVRLFASGVDCALSPPIESFYLASPEGGGMAQLVSAIEQEYRALGIVSVGVTESPDHATTELEAMSMLCGLEAEAWEANDEPRLQELIGRERTFLAMHVTVWFPQFRNRVAASGESAFYRDLVAAAHAFIVHDVDWLRMLSKVAA